MAPPTLGKFAGFMSTTPLNGDRGVVRASRPWVSAFAGVNAKRYTMR
ncbi:glutamine synthetase [Aspergillus luchuensis]|uniref:Glutamine synthetase n=1 Tax=Aspergillus kawachii TaxID=1069201 RepID=A0A146F690_ASPKA|nr:glutamine synthetase [Aspergillus luchuensis]